MNFIFEMHMGLQTEAGYMGSDIVGYRLNLFRQLTAAAPLNEDLATKGRCVKLVILI